MALFNWDNKLKTNITICDQQHEKLISLLNELHDSMKSGKDKDVIGNTLNELIAYTFYHFQTEETLLEQNEFPYLNNHKAEHAYLTNQVKDLKARYERGEIILTIEVLTFLKDWVVDHIIGVDKNYSAFLRNKGVL